MFFSCVTVYIWFAVGRTAKPFHAQNNSLDSGHTLRLLVQKRFLTDDCYHYRNKQLFHKTFVYMRPEKRPHHSYLSPCEPFGPDFRICGGISVCESVCCTAFKTTWGARQDLQQAVCRSGCQVDNFGLQDLMVPVGFHL